LGLDLTKRIPPQEESNNTRALRGRDGLHEVVVKKKDGLMCLNMTKDGISNIT
jgi:hypothetical protein